MKVNEIQMEQNKDKNDIKDKEPMILLEIILLTLKNGQKS
jgi:hypothetical protein